MIQSSTVESSSQSIASFLPRKKPGLSKSLDSLLVHLIPKFSHLPTEVKEEDLALIPSYCWLRKNTELPKDPITKVPREWDKDSPGETTFEELSKLYERFSSILISSSKSEVLTACEVKAIQLFSTDECMLFNVALMTEENKALPYLQGMNRGGFTTSQEVFSASMALNEVLSAALRKLPPFEGAVYRGLKLDREKIAKWYSYGTIAYERLAASFSKSPNVALSFALRDITPLANDLNEIPAVIVMNSKKGKAISDYCVYEEESEILYCPGLLARALGFEFIVYRNREIAVIYQEELNRTGLATKTS